MNYQPTCGGHVFIITPSVGIMKLNPPTGLWTIHHNVINPTIFFFMVFRVTYLFGVSQCYNFLPIMQVSPSKDVNVQQCQMTSLTLIHKKIYNVIA